MATAEIPGLTIKQERVEVQEKTPVYIFHQGGFVDTDHAVPRIGRKRPHSLMEEDTAEVDGQQSRSQPPPNISNEATSKDASTGHEELNADEFLHDCESWEKWFIARQRDDEPVSEFKSYLQTLATRLRRTGEPNAIQQFHRLRTGFRRSIREILDAQIIQPRTYDELVSVALRIEEKERNLQSHLRRKPPHPPATVKLPPPPTPKGPKQSRPDPFPKSRSSSHFHSQSPNTNGSRNSGPLPSGLSKRAARKMSDISRFSTPSLLGAPSTVAESPSRASLCFTCGGPNHKSSECSKRAPATFNSH